MTEKSETSLFEQGWEYVKQNEGGYVDDESDNGGATKYCISLRFLKGLGINEGDVNDDNKINEEEVRTLARRKRRSCTMCIFGFRQSVRK